MAVVRKSIPATVAASTKVTLPDVQAAFAKHWGGREYRPFQNQVVGSLLSGVDTLGVFAVGMGKSAVFQAPAAVLPGTTLVISPLIALMKDQVDGSRARGVAADCINSNMDEREIEAAMKRCASGEVKLLYVAPERLVSPAFNRMLRALHVPLVACDEAHCCSRFSSFRPAYLRIRQCINQLATRPVIVALTATMTAHIEPEVIKALGMRENYARFVGDPVRSNLEYRNVWATDTRRGGEWGELDKVLPRLAGGEGRHIVYTTSRKGAEIIAGKLTEKTGMDGGQIGYYHAGMQRDDRRRLQDEFVGGRKRVIVATVAFGMGIDIPDIRTVVNFGIPGSMEDVVQMGGRAGRDGNRSLCLCIGSDYSEGLQTRFINGEHPEWQTYEEVHAWLRANLEPNDTLYMSAEAIVKRMGESGGKRGTYDASAVGSVLHKFEAYGVVTRRPMSSASDITLMPAAADAELTGNAARVRDALVAIIGRPIPGQTRTGMVEGPAVAERSGVPAYLVNAALLRMVDQNLIRKMPSYNGKSTTWNPGEHLKPLAEIISREEVEERRRLELERLQHVVDYVRAPSPAQYIRDYFAKPT